MDGGLVNPQSRSMTSVIFVHGTGVRQPQYVETFQLIQKHLGSAVTVVPCVWGEELGVRLNANGASIPLYDATLALDPQPAENSEIIRWQQLYHDPLYELRLLSLKPVGEPTNPFGEQPSDRLQSRLANFQASPELQVELVQGGIAETFATALRTVTQSEAYEQVLITAADTLPEMQLAVARAIIAQAIRESKENQQYPVLEIDAALRDQVVENFNLALGDQELGIGEWLIQPLMQLAAPVGTYFLKRRRGAITDVASPFAGDILLYQARGEQIRDFIQQTIEQAEPPVVLLAHSLGGIACVDLLVKQHQPKVELLITVGSQAPFLYELNALSSLEYGHPLPTHFPHWLNIYDLRDILSYIGANVFPNRVQDVQVDNKQPFPQAHSAYWTNPATWKAITPRLP